jgi:hypothetical protein
MKKIIGLFLLLSAGLVYSGTNNLPQVTGSIIQKAHVNDPRTAMYGDWVPRNGTGTVTDQAGGLGTSTFKWGTSYINALNIGTPSNGHQISETTTAFTFDTATGGSFIFDINSVNFLTIDSNGVDLQNTKTDSMPFEGREDRVASSGSGGLGEFVYSSGNSGTFSTSSTSFTDISNMSVTIDHDGSPVKLQAQPISSTSTAGFVSCGSSGSQAICQIAIVKNGTIIGIHRLQSKQSAGSAGDWIPCTSISYVDISGAASGDIYKLQAKSEDGVDSLSMFNCIFTAYEL